MVHFFLFLACAFTVRAQTYVEVTQQEDISAATLGFLIGSEGTYDVTNYKITYNTTDTDGNPTVASGLIALPTNRNVEYPVAVYMHGTVTGREQVPSRPQVPERILTDAVASYGYVGLAPDYLGLGDNPGFHPYVHAESEASAGRDLILAARQWLTDQEILFNDQLFLSGYSQGGHAVQALHRDLQTNPADDGLTVTAAGHLSGPYSISDVMRRATFEDTPATLPGYIVYTYVSYDNVYGIYNGLNEVFKEPYLDVIERYDAEEIDGSRFNAELTTLLEDRDERLADMFQDSIREQLRTNDPDSRIIQALRRNDTYEWAPEAPTLIYYCTADEQVPFENSIKADSAMRANGSTTVTLTSGGDLSHTGCVEPAMLETIALFESLATRRDVTSTGSPVALAHVGLAPNPVSATASLRFYGLDPGTYGYTLYDAAGRETQRGQLANDGSLQLRQTGRSGLHVLRLTLPDGRFTVRKVLLQ